MAETEDTTPPPTTFKKKESPRDRRFRRGKGKKARRNPLARGPKFTGDTEDLKDHVYDVGYNQSDQYTTTTREISHHVGRSYKNGADVKRSIDGLRPMVIPIPPDPVHPDPLNPSAVLIRIWEREVDGYVRRKDTLDQNLRTLYSLIWGQCSPSMKAKLEARNTHKDIRDRMDAMSLLLFQNKTSTLH